MKYIQAFFMSLGMFSSIPCPYRPWNEKARHLMLFFLPLVGLLIGLLWYGLFRLLDWSGIPLQLQAAVLMLFPFVITGFIHLDGFMDTSDAVLSRRPLEEQLRILKDPHTGAFAVISVAVLFTVCFASVLSIVEQINLKQALGVLRGDPMLSLIFIPVISRCGSALAVMIGKPLSHSQYNLNGDSKRPMAEIVGVGIIGITVLITTFYLGAVQLPGVNSYIPLIALIGTMIAYLSAISSSAYRLKGVSGDLAGYALTIAEAFGLIVLACIS